GGPGTVYLYDRSLPSNNAKLQIINRDTSTAYEPYRLSGEIGIPVYLSSVQAVIEKGAYLAAPISGSSYSKAYVKAEGDFTVANNSLVVDGYTLELPQDYSFDSISVKNNGKITTPAASGTFT
ncbi:hypothetical protein OQJ59_16675, partial [Microbulbifer thermotolerans]|uniref:hypothetical protein n=1 Tax=Microbulbifer thermotolerans TaxID=252514 RepID=UPI00224AE90C